MANQRTTRSNTRNPEDSNRANETVDPTVDPLEDSDVEMAARAQVQAQASTPSGTVTPRRSPEELLEELEQAPLEDLSVEQLEEHTRRVITLTKLVEISHSRKRNRQDSDSDSAETTVRTARDSGALAPEWQSLTKTHAPKLVEGASQQEFDSWMQEVVNTLSVAGVEGSWSETTRKTKWVALGLKDKTLAGRVNQRMENPQDEGPLLLSGLFEMIQNHIQPPARRRAEVADQYRNLRQKRDQSVADYVNKVVQLEALLGYPIPDDARRVDYLFAGLRPELRHELHRVDALQRFGDNPKGLIDEAQRLEGHTTPAQGSGSFAGKSHAKHQGKSPRQGSPQSSSVGTHVVRSIPRDQAKQGTPAPGPPALSGASSQSRGGRWKPRGRGSGPGNGRGKS